MDSIFFQVFLLAFFTSLLFVESSWVVFQRIGNFKEQMFFSSFDFLFTTSNFVRRIIELKKLLTPEKLLIW